MRDGPTSAWSDLADRKKLSFALLVLTSAVLLYEYSAIEDIIGDFKRMKYSSKGVQGPISRLRTITATHHATNSSAVALMTSHPEHNGSVADLVKSLDIDLDTFLSIDHILGDDDWLALMEARQKLRVGRMNSFCDKYRIPKRNTGAILVKKPIRHALYSNDQYKFLFGLVLKVASNHFKKAFKKLGGTKRLYLMSNEQCRGRIEKFSRIIFVRHPLTRILSAYQEKFVEHHITHFTQIGRRIIGTLREGATSAEIKSGRDVTFPEFVEYLTGGVRARSNTHWDLIWLHNGVCELRYDFIGKIETIADDYRYMIHTLSRGKLDSAKYELMREYRSYHGHSEKLRAQYRNVSQPVLERWYQIYRRDFEIFGYEMDILGPRYGQTMFERK